MERYVGNGRGKNCFGYGCRYGKDDEIFFYCDSLNDMKSMADKGREDFTIAECIGFGTYEELL